MNTVIEELSEFLTDKMIAYQLGFSASWVRQQRWLRVHGKPHVLTIDPVMIGSKPRYVRDDFLAWMESQKTGGTGFKKEFRPKHDPHQDISVP